MQLSVFHSQKTGQISLFVYERDVASNRMKRIQGESAEFWSNAVDWSSSYRTPRIYVELGDGIVGDQSIPSFQEFQSQMRIVENVSQETLAAFRSAFPNESSWNKDVLQQVFYQAIDWESKQREIEYNASN